MEHKGLLPCSKEHTAGFYPEPFESNLHIYILFIYGPFEYCPPIYI
jgi:hypothetical protein